MRHLFNRLSDRNLCEVKHPKLTDNVSDRGQVLGSPESMCPKCGQFWERYLQKWPFLEPKESIGPRNNKGPFAPF